MCSPLLRCLLTPHQWHLRHHVGEIRGFEQPELLFPLAHPCSRSWPLIPLLGGTASLKWRTQELLRLHLGLCSWFGRPVRFRHRSGGASTRSIPGGVGKNNKACRAALMVAENVTSSWLAWLGTAVSGCMSVSPNTHGGNKRKENTANKS